MIPNVMIKYRTPYAKKDFMERFYARQWERFCNWIDGTLTLAAADLGDIYE